MHHTITSIDVSGLVDEANAFAARLCWRLRLPPTARDDLRQELLADLIRRLPKFEPKRGSIGGFASVVLRNRSSQIAARLTREWTAHGGPLLSLDGPAGSKTPEALPDQDDGTATAELRIDVARVLTRLHARDRALCAAVVRWPVDHLVKQGFGTRATLYRRLRELRHVFASHGLAA